MYHLKKIVSDQFVQLGSVDASFYVETVLARLRLCFDVHQLKSIFKATFPTVQSTNPAQKRAMLAPTSLVQRVVRCYQPSTARVINIFVLRHCVSQRSAMTSSNQQVSHFSKSYPLRWCAGCHGSTLVASLYNVIQQTVSSSYDWRRLWCGGSTTNANDGTSVWRRLLRRCVVCCWNVQRFERHQQLMQRSTDASFAVFLLVIMSGQWLPVARTVSNSVTKWTDRERLNAVRLMNADSRW